MMLKTLKGWLARLAAAWARPPEAVTVAAPATPAAEPPKGMTISTQAVLTIAGAVVPKLTADEVFKLAQPLPGVVPKGRRAFAMDDASTIATYAWATQSSMYAEGLTFLGYPYLAELTQRPEYRRPAEILSKEMTRKWIKIQASGDDPGKAEKVKALEAEFERLGVKKAIRKLIQLDGQFGRSHLYLDFGTKRLGDGEDLSPLALTSAKIPRGSLLKLRVIEPMWVYPNQYNSTDPTSEDFYRPATWFVMGREIHRSRLLTLVTREVPDMLKPAYSFGGLSLSQIAKPYVDNWLRTRQSVSDITHSFSIPVLSTNLANALTGGAGQDMLSRAQLFNQLRDNKGLMMLDKDSESFMIASASLSSLDKLQAQAQEQMAAVYGIPLVKLLGITPSGLNASSDGEIRVYYDWIESQQEDGPGPIIGYLLQVAQLSLFGEVDPEITFAWEPLWTLDAGEEATRRKTEAETDAILIENGVIDAGESRERLARDEDSPYASLDLNKVIEPPAEEESGNDLMSMLHGNQAPEDAPASPTE